MQTHQDLQRTYDRGSQWRIWDLHVHTPASLIHQYPGTDPWDQFLLDLEGLPESVKVLGINDYLFLDGYKRILAERKQGRLKNIETVFPVIELRIDKFGGTDGHLSRVNYHVVFSDQLSPEIIEQQFLNALTARYKLKPGVNTPLWSGTLNRAALEDLGRKIIASVPEDKQHQFSEPLIEGFNHLCLSQRDVVDLTESHWFKNKCLVGVGKTEWADIKWNDQAVADKKTVINDAHIVFISATNVEHWRKAKMSLKKAAVNDLLLDCSDAHYLSSSTQKDRIGKCLTWIKADPTFEGLRHALREPESRIAIASEAPDEASKRERRTKIIQEIRIVKRAGSSLTETWFENKIPLNSGLVAIIGNKGKGKSALTDTIGLLGNCKQDKYFTFLTDRTFRLGGKNSKATHFDGSITWLDSSERTTQLSGASEPGEHEYVKYLPQQYLERICGTVGQTEESEFDREVKKVILSHIRPEETHNCDSLDSLIALLTKQADENRRICKDELHKLNERIVEVEERIDPAHRQKLEAELVRKKSELSAHQSMKPALLGACQQL